MAFNEILVGRLNRYVQKLLVIKNTALRSLAPDLQTVLPLASGNEERYLQGWNRYMQQFTQAAVAAQFSEGEIRNPAGSNIVAVIESLIFVGSAGDVPKVILAVGLTTDLTTSQNPVDRIDARGNQASALKLSVGSVAANPTGPVLQVGVTANASVQVISTVNQEITILPGDALVVSGGAVNTLVNAFITWRERLLESSESS